MNEKKVSIFSVYFKNIIHDVPKTFSNNIKIKIQFNPIP